MPIEGRGRIAVWEGASLWVLAAARETSGTDYHAHHAIQITLSLEGGFELRTEHERLTGPAVAVASDARHVFRASGIGAFLFLEPESRAGRPFAAAAFRGTALAALPLEPLAAPMAALAAWFRADGSEAEMIRHGQALVAALVEPEEAPAADKRVAAMLAYVAEGIDGALSLPEAASAACLSPSRARHLFAAQTGLPFKTFVLWRRIEKAVALYAAGASLTEAAHEAGFADSAHLSRTFRRTFGLPAAALQVNARFTASGADPKVGR
jgi:AraC family transcriptional regulator